MPGQSYFCPGNFFVAENYYLQRLQAGVGIYLPMYVGTGVAVLGIIAGSLPFADLLFAHFGIVL